MFSLRTPESNRMKIHQEMYKVKTPPWREVYRKKCFERLRNSRSRLVDQFRRVNNDDKKDVIEDLMAEEWKILVDEQSNLPSLRKDTDMQLIDDDKEVEKVLSIIEEIKKELIEEERKMLAEHHAILEAANLQLTINWLEQDEVICPICQKYPLFQKHSVIFCKCGMRIDTERDGLTLVHLKKQLTEGLDLHSRNCSNTPDFSVISMTSITNLAMICEKCSFMFIII